MLIKVFRHVSKAEHTSSIGVLEEEEGATGFLFSN